VKGLTPEERRVITKEIASLRYRIRWLIQKLEGDIDGGRCFDCETALPTNAQTRVFCRDCQAARVRAARRDKILPLAERGLALHEEGYSLAQIALFLCVDRSTLRAYFHKLGLTSKLRKGSSHKTLAPGGVCHICNARVPGDEVVWLRSPGKGPARCRACDQIARAAAGEDPPK
jgi:hypothetical protein